MRLFLYRGRRVLLEGQADRMGVVFHIEPCPSSRYVSCFVDPSHAWAAVDHMCSVAPGSQHSHCHPSRSRHVTDMPEALARRPSKYHQAYVATTSSLSSSEVSTRQQHQQFGVVSRPSGSSGADAAAAAAPTSTCMSLLATALVPPGAAAGAGGHDTSSTAVRELFRRRISIADGSSSSSMTDEDTAAVPAPAPPPPPPPVPASVAMSQGCHQPLAVGHPTETPLPLSDSFGSLAGMGSYGVSGAGVDGGGGGGGGEGGLWSPQAAVPVFDEGVLDSIFHD